jgi:hypothetical protein
MEEVSGDVEKVTGSCFAEAVTGVNCDGIDETG